MKTIDFSYFIERYIAGEMDEAEKQWFQKELEGNIRLREEVRLRSETEKVLRDNSVMLLRNKLRVIEKQRADASSPGKQRRNSPMRYAAVIAVLVLLGGSVYLFNRPLISTDELMDQLNKPYEGITASRSVEADQVDNFKTGLDYYNIHDYRTAAEFFSKVLEANPGDMGSEMLFGISNFNNTNYPVAEQSFNKVITNNENLFIEDAQWYLALCYIKTKELKKAEKQLDLIKNSESIHRKDAAKLFRSLR